MRPFLEKIKSVFNGKSRASKTRLVHKIAVLAFVVYQVLTGKEEIENFQLKNFGKLKTSDWDFGERNESCHFGK